MEKNTDKKVKPSAETIEKAKKARAEKLENEALIKKAEA